MPLLHRFVGTPIITFLTSTGERSQAHRDSQTGYRAFRRDTMQYVHLTCNGMELASEMLDQVRRGPTCASATSKAVTARGSASRSSIPGQTGWRHLKLILLLAPDIARSVPG